MDLQGKTIGIGLTGSFCTLDKVIEVITALKDEYGVKVVPVMSYNTANFNTKFGTALSWKESLEGIGIEEIIYTIPDAEPIGPTAYLDAFVIAPCSGNTVAKLVNGITDTPVLMAAKAQLRNGLPLVIAISTNDGLGTNARNIGLLLNQKNVYIVPFGQDNPTKKPNSLVADFAKLPETIDNSIKGKQIQPLLLQF